MGLRAVKRVRFVEMVEVIGYSLGGGEEEEDGDWEEEEGLGVPGPSGTA